MTNYNTPQEAFDGFWKPIVCDPAGFFEPDAVKAELYDYLRVLENVPKVYDYVTGSRCTKPLTDAQVVMSLSDDYHEELHKDLMTDIYDALKTCNTLDQALETFRDLTGVS